VPRKWNRVVAENDPFVAQQQLDGTLTQGVRLTLCDEDVDMMRHGYKCINCLENLETAFPEACPLCSYPMARLQAELFARVFAGHIPGARTGLDWEAEADRLEERKERRAFERRARESNIIVPKAIV
jgi:hypothetical protein